MTQIKIDPDAYEAARQQLSTAVSDLRTATGALGSAVPGNAFGPIGAMIPPVLNGLGSVVEQVTGVAATFVERSSGGIEAAVERFVEIDDEARSDLDRIAGEL